MSSSSSASTSSNPSLIYACVARSTTVLSSASFPVSGGGQLHQSIISRAVQLTNDTLPLVKKVDSSQVTYSQNDLFVSYNVNRNIPDGLSFVVVSLSSAYRRASFEFLNAIQRAFEEMYNPEEIEIMHEGDAKNEFDEVIKREMERHGAPVGSSHGIHADSERDNMRKAREEIDNVRGIMTENIERVLERGERIDLLVDKTGRLNVGASEFRRRSKGLRRKMWWKNVKLMILLVFVVMFLLYLFVGFGCGLPSWQKCIGK